MTTNELIDRLNEQLTREVSTTLRYLVQSATLRGVQNEPIRSMYSKEVTDEMGHAQYLAEQIAMLGGTPTPTPETPSPPSDPRQMLTDDIAAERTDVRNYVRLAELAEKEERIALKAKMEDQAADEDAHREEMERLLG